MDDHTSLVHSFPASDHHRANNLSAYLAAHSIDSSILYSESEDEPDGEWAVFVSNDQIANATLLCSGFVEDETEAIERLTTPLNPRLTFIARLLLVYLLPGFLVGYGAFVTYQALNTSSVIQSSSDSYDEAEGASLLILGVVYLAVLAVFKKKGVIS